MIKACIFDLDGVIIDTAKYHYLAWKRLAAEFGEDLTLEENEKLKGVSRMQSLDIILALAKLQKTEAEREALATKKNEWFVEYISRITPDEMYPGVRDLLHAIRRLNIGIALASSSKNAAMVIRLLDIAAEFDAVIDGTMITQTKPDPEIFLKAAAKLGVQPSDALVFEDAEAGVEAACRAGMKCVGIGSPALLHKANIVITNTADFDLKNLNTL